MLLVQELVFLGALVSEFVQPARYLHSDLLAFSSTPGIVQEH